MNVDLAQKEHTVQTMDSQHSLFAQMAPILMWKAGVIVNHVMQATGVQVLDWKHRKNVPMEHTVTQLGLIIAFCVQKVIGERSPCLAAFIHALFHSLVHCQVDNYTDNLSALFVCYSI